MSEDSVIYYVPKKKVPHLKVVVDYLNGLTYKKIEEKYGITRGAIQYALEKIGVRPNRVKSSARLKSRAKEYKTKGAYLQNAGFIPVAEHEEKGNNPILEDDLDIMERMDKTNGTSDPSCEIDVDEEGEITYDHND